MADIDFGGSPTDPALEPLATATYLIALKDTGVGAEPLEARVVATSEIAPKASPSLTGTVSLPGVDTGLEMKAITNDPSAPAAGMGRLYAKSLAGQVLPFWLGAEGSRMSLGPALWERKFTMWQATGATAGSSIGGTWGGNGTQAFRAWAATTAYTRLGRVARYSSVVTTTNQVIGHNGVAVDHFRGDATTRGGYLFYARFGLDNWTTGNRLAVGMSNNVGEGSSVQTGSSNDFTLFSVNTADTTIFFRLKAVGAPSMTSINTGVVPTTNEGYEVWIYCPPNATEIFWRIVTMSTGAVAEGSTTATGSFPTVNTIMGPQVLGGNAANTLVNALQLGVDRYMVIEAE